MSKPRSSAKTGSIVAQKIWKKYCSLKLHWSLFAHDWHEFQVWWVNSPKYHDWFGLLNSHLCWLIFEFLFHRDEKKQFPNGCTIKSSCAWSNLPLCGLNLHFGLWNVVKLLQNLHMCQGQNMIDDGVFERHSIRESWQWIEKTPPSPWENKPWHLNMAHGVGNMFIILWMVAKSCTATRMVFQPLKQSWNKYHITQLVQDFCTIHQGLPWYVEVGFPWPSGILTMAILSHWWYAYPSEKYEFVSWDDYSIPNMMGKSYSSHVPNHQPVMLHSPRWCPTIPIPPIPFTKVSTESAESPCCVPHLWMLGSTAQSHWP